MFKKILCLPFLVLSLSFSQAAFSHDEGHHRHHCMHNVINSLDLTADQKAKIKSIKEQAKSELKGKWQERMAIHKQMKTLSHAKTVDHAKLNAYVLTDIINLYKQNGYVFVSLETALKASSEPEKKAIQQIKTNVAFNKDSFMAWD